MRPATSHWIGIGHAGSGLKRLDIAAGLEMYVEG